MDLCAGTLYFRPENAQTARVEAQRRGLDCTTLYGAIQADQAARRAAVMSAPYQYQPYQLPMPTVAPQAQRTVCTTSRIGNELQTVCR